MVPPPVGPGAAGAPAGSIRGLFGEGGRSGSGAHTTARRARVACRYQPGALRTSQLSSPASCLAASKACSMHQRRLGPRIEAKGVYRDAVRSSQSPFVKAMGLRWISLMWIVRIPRAGRVWTLPFLTVLAPSARYHAEQGRRHSGSRARRAARGSRACICPHCNSGWRTRRQPGRRSPCAGTTGTARFWRAPRAPPSGTAPASPSCPGPGAHHPLDRRTPLVPVPTAPRPANPPPLDPDTSGSSSPIPAESRHRRESQPHPAAPACRPLGWTGLLCTKSSLSIVH